MTELSRRTLLGAGAAGVAMTVLAAAPEAFAATSQARLYTRGRFVRLRRKAFQITDHTGTWTVRLAAVSDLPLAATGATSSFTLTFRSAAAGPPQGTYLLRRPGFASTMLFLVPSDAACRTYQAVVNTPSGPRRR